MTGTRFERLPGVTECKGWDSALLDDGAVWSVVPKENRIESADFFARAGEGYFDLGPGTSGSLTPCGDAAYFVRDPQRDGDPARLMRWSADGELDRRLRDRQGRPGHPRPHRAAAATRSRSPR